MTDSNRSMSEVPGLIEERRRYEGWLSALDARRESTPKHVFDRVRADYETRLARVGEQLASHRQAIEEEQASVKSRVSLLEAEEQLQRDERAELDLRAHVGELTGEDADAAFSTVDETITQLVTEKESLQARIRELQTLLDDGAPRVIPTEPPASQAVASPEPAAAEEPNASSVEAVAEPEVATLGAPAPDAGDPPADSSDVEASSEEPQSAPVAAEAEQAPARREMSSSSFDELAFLSSVVGKEEEAAMARQGASAPASLGKAAPAGQQVANHAPLIERRNGEPILRPSDLDRDEPVAESLLAGIDKAKRATGDLPLAANVPANTPIVLRPSGTIEQSKTLKCNECGATNYPTEWYCERCGAELAAL